MTGEIVRVLLFPLLGGFLALLINHRLRLSVFQTHSGEKLLLLCALIGAVSLVLALWIIQIIVGLLGPNCTAQLVAFRTKWFPFSAVNMLSTMLPALVAGIANTFCPKEKAYLDYLQTSADALESFLQNAAREIKMVMVTLKSGRVYVGLFNDTTVKIKERNFIKLIPFASGFRFPTNSDEYPTRVKFVTYYGSTVEALLAGGDSSQIIELQADRRHATFRAGDMGVILRMSEIEVASRFDPTVFGFLNRDISSQGWEKVSVHDDGPLQEEAHVETSPGDNEPN